MRYTAKDLSVLTPTKDRPQALTRMLNSLVDQEISVGRVLIVGSGTSLDEVIEQFKNKLPIEYFQSDVSGQIRQRNLGISKLDESSKLVACIDDDIVFEEGAINSMIEFWNACEDDTAAVAFNIIGGSMQPDTPNLLKRLFFVSSKYPGRVLKSGFVSSASNVPSDVRVQWVPGGVTVWRQALLKDNFHEPIDAKRVDGEDLRFSYPLGKKYPLYVCAKAAVRHEHKFDYKVSNIHKYYAENHILCLLLFVSQNKELSLFLCCYGAFFMGLKNLLSGLLTFNNVLIQEAMGRFSGLSKGMFCLVTKKDLKRLIV